MDYQRSRRIMMQMALCVIFAGSVALAELVTHQRRTGAAMRMAGPQEFGPVGRINLPGGWVLKRQGKGPVLFVDQEPDRPDHQGRTLTGRWANLTAPVPVMDYLQSTELSDDSVRIIEYDGHAVEDINMGGVPGVLLAVKRDEATGAQDQWIACCVRPSGLAITLVLDCPDSDDPESDKLTLRNIAASMAIRN